MSQRLDDGGSVSVREQFESYESFVISRVVASFEEDHRCRQSRIADTAANGSKKYSAGSCEIITSHLHMAHSLGLAVSRTPRQFQNFNDVFRSLDRTGVRANAAVVLD